MRKRIMVIILVCVMCFVAGLVTSKVIVSIELQNGPIDIIGDTELTIYLQELYRSAYNAGMMRGFAYIGGYEDMTPVHEQYYDWMKAHNEDEEEALKQEGWYYIQDTETVTTNVLKRVLGIY